jgi:hypothetical protein
MTGKISTADFTFDTSSLSATSSVAGRGLMKIITRLPFGMLSGPLDARPFRA